jgi:succinate-semialdehyde dehydrogenase/glutarate-semialdehyde dehydrogenase
MAIVTPIETPAGARRRLRLASPATLEPIGEIEVATVADVAAALGAARAAQPAWAARPVAERARVLSRALEILLARQDDFIDVIRRESGKARTEALLIEIYAACDALAYHAKRAAKILKPERRRLHGPLALMKRLEIVYRPLGVVGVISPWNGPFILSINPLLQALVAGNAVLLKPSEVTPYSGKLAVDLFAEAGLPPGLATALLGDGETGAALVESGVDKIAFTGSVATGRKVAEACARRLLPCTLELGGKDPMIVCADADLDRAAAGAVAGAFFNTGQICFSTERVYVVEEVADAFVSRVVERTRRLRQGASGEYDLGPIFWPPQLAVIEAHVADAVARGARVLTGGRRAEGLAGLFYEPTVLVDVTHDMRIMREETFGPVLPVMRVPDEEAAIRLANDSPYGLAASVWSADVARARALSTALEAGSVCVNDMTVTYGVPEAPFGGRRQSGVGQVNGVEGLRGYCYAQPILVDRFGGRQTAAHYPYSAAKDSGVQRFMRLLWGTRLGRLLGA